jgi:hypothetical protein
LSRCKEAVLPFIYKGETASLFFRISEFCPLFRPGLFVKMYCIRCRTGRERTSEQGTRQMQNLDTLFPLIQTILEKLDFVESQLDALTTASGKRRVEPGWLSIQDAARLAGLSVVATQTRIRREKERVDGVPLRTRHGAVHTGDWKAYLDSEAQRKTGRGRVIRDALEKFEF